MVEVDPLARQKPLVDRGLMSDLLNKLKSDLPSGSLLFSFCVSFRSPFADLNVVCPKYVVIEKEQATYSDILASTGIKFPVGMQ